MEGVLKSWAVPKGPSYDPTVRRLALMNEDHPFDYAAFEGVIPAGNYGAGNVIIWDQGTWEFIEPGDDPVKALQSGKLTFRLQGKKMFGDANIWQSNRKAASRKVPTLASKLTAKKKPATKAATKKAPTKKATTKAKAPAKAPAARSRAASAPSRSSRAAKQPSARPTRRRPPR